MEKRNILVGFIIVILSIGLIVTIPIFTLSIQLSTYDVIEETDDSFVYAPSNSSPVEKLNIYADRGDIEIQYVSPLVNYFAMIEVNIKMSGNNLAGKDYKEFFEVDWDDSNPSPTFRIEFNAGVVPLEIEPLIEYITIKVNLRKDVLFDINVIAGESNVDLIVPFKVPINNIFLNVSRGNLFYDFQYCTLEGNITGIANDGNIELVAYNPEYTRNTIWTYNSNAGDITININHSNQYNIMNNNITGSLVGNEFGDIIVYYYDNTANIGAMITLNDTKMRLDLAPYQSDWEGFYDPVVLKDSEGIPYGYLFTSTDFPAITNYNLLLVGLILNNYEGGYEVHLFSS
ncbi:MAG: hypothetical protein ACXABO_05655 [Promethearchaeota archaeon]|jgi:hypothetical protein